jgi:hypothetical protein
MKFNIYDCRHGLLHIHKFLFESIMNSFRSLFIILFIFPLVQITLCLLDVKEKQIYLVLVAGDPLAFQQANATLHNHDQLHPSERYSLYNADQF